MSDKSCCDCCSENEISFFDLFGRIVLIGGAIFITFWHIETTVHHSREIKELFSRLEKNHESSQDS